MATQIVDSNTLLADRANSVRDLFNSGTVLRLYKALILPTPADTIATYSPSECDFDTYAPAALDPNWGGITKVMDGEYQTLSPMVTYPPPAALGNTIYGLFVTDGAAALYFAFLFDSPIPFNPGDPSLIIQIAYQVWAKSSVV